MDNSTVECKMVSKAEILELLKHNDRALARALVVLNARQTADERVSRETKHVNSRGFNAAHAQRGTSMANFYLRTGFLTPKQMGWWRAPAAVGGQMRIGIYTRQLLEAAAEKAARKM
jgi:hypothetical protein